MAKMPNVIDIQVRVRIHMTIRDAVALRIAGREVREDLVKCLREKLAEPPEEES